MVEGGSDGEPERWDAERVRALRAWLDDSQATLADRIGTRQQTVSEWETGSSAPRRMSRRLLRMVAEDSGFYDAERRDADGQDRTPEGATPDRGADDRGGDADGR
jgi:transcriptional regulator with XRE-family HTH domain